MDRKGVNVQCPFWHWYDDRTLKISCEGCKGVLAHSLKFKSKPELLMHKHMYCEGSFSDCEYCKAIMEKFKE